MKEEWPEARRRPSRKLGQLPAVKRVGGFCESVLTALGYPQPAQNTQLKRNMVQALESFEYMS